MEKKKHNKLIHSISPYLKQHAYNPVDWQEWNQSVFDQAEIENKLVLVSIGYSACHWCHVMAHESFEDEATAEIMNRFFICVKIDREELPDVDQIYMDACQLVNGNGGWPLNAFVLPDKRPIHAMTYAPKAEWQKILQAIHQLWNENRPAAFQYAEKLSHGIKNLSLPPILKTTEKKEGLSENVFQTFVLNFDEVYGGNNRAPKFPMPCNWRYLLEFSVLTHNKKAEDMALFTLNQMALGGIYDVLEGGFSRYSVDQKWFAPHFEKMLYDNAQLISLYSYAYAISKDDFFKTIALECIQFCQNEWKTKAHLYQSATDADSEGVEGLYYTYTYDELNTVLGTNTDLFCQYYQCTEAGNWEHDRNILFALDNRKSAAKTFNLSIEAFSVKIETCHKTLRTFRKNRIAPNIDYKCICSWNALMLKGISEAAFYLNEPKLILEAEQLADAILDNFYINQKLMRIHFDGASKIDAFIEDHATLIDGLIALYQCNLNESYLLIAESLCRHCINSFYHAEKGFFTFNSGQPLLTAKFDINDDVICSGNSIMAHNLWKLSWYFDCEEWRRMASNMSHSMQELVFQSGPWYSNWASLELILEFGTEQYILSSEKNLQKRLPFKKYQTLPNALFGFIEKQSQIPLFQGKQYQGKRLIFPCKDMICESPIEFE